MANKNPRLKKKPNEEMGIGPIENIVGNMLTILLYFIITHQNMTATAHALMGGAIAASISNPSIGLPLAALSHPLMDMIPHYDFGIGWRKKSKLSLFWQSSLDLLLGLILTYLIFGRFTDIAYLTAAVFLSEVWDLLQMPYLLFGWKGPFYLFYKVQHEINAKAKLPWGILTQVATVATISLFPHIVRFWYPL